MISFISPNLMYVTSYGYDDFLYISLRIVSGCFRYYALKPTLSNQAFKKYVESVMHVNQIYQVSLR